MRPLLRFQALDRTKNDNRSGGCIEQVAQSTQCHSDVSTDRWNRTKRALHHRQSQGHNQEPGAVVINDEMEVAIADRQAIIDAARKETVPFIYETP